MKQYLFFGIFISLAVMVLPGWSQSPNVVQEQEDFLFAEQLATKGMHDLAAEQFRQYAEKYPSSPRSAEALFRAGKSLEELAKWNEAVSVYGRLLLNYPQSALVDQGLYRRGTALVKLGSNWEAAKSFERVALFAPKSEWIPQAQLQAGIANFRAGESQSALDALFVLLENYPSHPLRLQARCVLGEIFAQKGDYTRALAELDRLVSESLDNHLAIKSGWLRAQIYQSIGRYSAADSVLQKLITSGIQSDTVGIAAAQVAQTLQLQGKFAAAKSTTEQALKRAYADSIQNILYRINSDNNYALGLFDEALAYLQKMTVPPQNEQIAIAFRRAMALVKLNREAEALAEFRQLLGEPMSLPWQGRLKTEAALQASEILLRRSQSTTAVQLLRETLRQPAVAPYGDRILLRLAEIQGYTQDDWPAARRSLTSLLELYPFSPLTDDSQLKIASSYEMEQNWPQAQTEYQRYLLNYPGADETERIARQQRGMPSSGNVAARDADEAFNRIFDLSLSGQPRSVMLSQWLHEQIYTFRNYRRGLTIIRLLLGEEVESQVSLQKLLYEIAHCHAQLAALPDLPAIQQAHLDTLNQSAELLRTNYPRNPWTLKAVALAADAKIARSAEPSERMQTLRQSIGYFVDSGADSLANDHRLQLARELLADNSEAALAELSNTMDALLQGTPSLMQRAQALYFQAMVELGHAKNEAAGPLLQQALELDLHLPQQVSARYMLAKLAMERKEWNTAMAAFADVADRYSYTSLGREAALQKCQILLQIDRRQDAANCVEELRTPDLPSGLWLYIDDIVDGEEKKEWLWLQTHLDKKDPQQRYLALVGFLNRYPGGENRDQVLAEAGALALQMQQLDVATGYFTQIAENGRDAELVMQARNRIGELYYEREMYKEALEQTLQSIAHLNGDYLMAAKARAAKCEYKLGNLARGDALAEEFRRNFTRNDLKAEIYYERGLLLMNNKEFKEAEKAFKSVSDDYEKRASGGLGELGLARLYVVLNRTEDALKRLTDLTSQSQDPQILATAYLNLADFYYENRQLENCITAGLRVLAVQERGEQHRLALNLLMNAYDDLRLWDRAIQMVRTYLDLYPNAQDVMQKETKVGIFLYYLKEYDRSLAILRDLKIKVDADTQTEIQYWIGKAEADRGNYQTAIAEFLKVKYVCKQTRWPWGVTALYEAGQLYRKIGELEKAKGLFQQIVQERGSADQFGRVALQKIEEIDAELRNPS
ncbi:MAG TPA: tetratricopeptide repeat protein [bacterium]|nr:tetratricopeptide repeat protein [bacterium]HPG46344.1 tetratricopeptide repeat protein [bacterium]HPM98462.1 tetratricopeptide repeat protein [bacterium]